MIILPDCKLVIRASNTKTFDVKLADWCFWIKGQKAFVYIPMSQKNSSWLSKEKSILVEATDKSSPGFVWQIAKGLRQIRID